MINYDQNNLFFILQHHWKPWNVQKIIFYWICIDANQVQLSNTRAKDKFFVDCVLWRGQQDDEHETCVIVTQSIGGQR